MTPRPIDPPRSAFEAALALARDGRFAEALADVTARAGAEPGETGHADAASTLAQVARLAQSAGDDGAALAALDQAVGYRPGWADLHLQRALACAALGRRPEAREAVAAALHIHPRFVGARLELALLDARDGLVGEALEAVRALASEARVSDPRAYEQGLRSLELADWDEAAALLKRALRVADPELEQRIERYDALVRQGQPADAARVLREVLPRHEGYPDLHFRLGAADLQQGMFDDALVSLARALELNPDFSAARVLLARALDALGARVGALEQIALVLQREPGHAEARALESEWGARGRRTPERAHGPRKGA